MHMPLCPQICATRGLRAPSSTPTLARRRPLAARVKCLALPDIPSVAARRRGRAKLTGRSLARLRLAHQVRACCSATRGVRGLHGRIRTRLMRVERLVLDLLGYSNRNCSLGTECDSSVPHSCPFWRVGSCEGSLKRFADIFVFVCTPKFFVTP